MIRVTAPVFLFLYVLVEDVSFLPFVAAFALFGVFPAYVMLVERTAFFGLFLLFFEDFLPFFEAGFFAALGLDAFATGFFFAGFLVFGLLAFFAGFAFAFGLDAFAAAFFLAGFLVFGFEDFFSALTFSFARSALAFASSASALVFSTSSFAIFAAAAAGIAAFAAFLVFAFAAAFLAAFGLDAAFGFAGALAGFFAPFFCVLFFLAAMVVFSGLDGALL